MNVKEEYICRLCLKVAENEGQLIDETTRNMFDVLLLRVNLNISEDPIVCKDCAEVAEKCFHFKSACMDKDDSIFSIVDDNIICRFCSNHLSGSNCVLLENLINDVTCADVFQKLMPKNFDITKNPVICTSCREDLECYVNFVEKCLKVEEKITKYIQNEGTPSSAYVNLREILCFSFNITEFDNTKMLAIKQEDLLENIEETYSEVYDGESIKTEDVLDIKDEEVNFNKIISETPLEMPVYSLNSPFTPTIADNRSTEEVPELPIFTCGKCTYRAKHKRGLKSHMLIHKDIMEVEIHKCTICTFETKYKMSLKIHMIIHKDITEVKMYKCSMCTFETKHKGYIKTHMLIHKDITQVEIYKCSMCTFKAKQKSNLKSHMIIHKDITEVEVYKCSMCTYETKRKSNLKTHTVIHKDITALEMYKCSMCTYETNRKGNLKNHMLTHKDIAEVEMYKCSMCTYETMKKGTLKIHMLIHKDVTEVEMYKCSICTYETKYKRSLKTHMLVHKDITEVKMYKCSMCTYEAKRKSNLKNHMLRHYIGGNV